MLTTSKSVLFPGPNHLEALRVVPLDLQKYPLNPWFWLQPGMPYFLVFILIVMNWNSSMFRRSNCCSIWPVCSTLKHVLYQCVSVNHRGCTTVVRGSQALSPRNIDFRREIANALLAVILIGRVCPSCSEYKRCVGQNQQQSALLVYILGNSGNVIVLCGMYRVNDDFELCELLERDIGPPMDIMDVTAWLHACVCEFCMVHVLVNDCWMRALDELKNVQLSKGMRKERLKRRCFLIVIVCICVWMIADESWYNTWVCQKSSTRWSKVGKNLKKNGFRG